MFFPSILHTVSESITAIKCQFQSHCSFAKDMCPCWKSVLQRVFGLYYYILLSKIWGIINKKDVLYTIMFLLSNCITQTMTYNPSQKSLATLRRKPSPASPLSMSLQWCRLFFRYFFEPTKQHWAGVWGKRKPLSNVIVWDCLKDEGLTLETSAKHHIPQATNIPYQPCWSNPYCLKELCKICSVVLRHVNQDSLAESHQGTAGSALTLHHIN